jgi:hypothetical protein
MRNYKTRVPGIDRSSEAKNPPTNGSSALQKGTKEYTNLAPTPGTGPAKFFGGGGKAGGGGGAMNILDPAGLLGGGKKKGGGIGGLFGF